MRALAFLLLLILPSSLFLAQSVRATGEARPDDGQLPPLSNLEPGRVPLNLAGKATIRIAPFYFWRRVYKLKGRSHKELFLMDEHGHFSPITDTATVSRMRTVAPTPLDLDHGDEIFRSPSSRFLARFLTGADEPQIQGRAYDSEEILRLVDLNSGSTSYYRVATEFGGADILRWHQKDDLLYYAYVAGSSTDRSIAMHQFDPKLNRSVFIGGAGGSLHFSADGLWIIWETGRSIESGGAGLGGITVNVTQLMAFNVTENKNYALTDDVSVNQFVEWAPVNTTATLP
jgi:hypothetical protein